MDSRILKLQLRLSEAEMKALEPAAPQMNFGGQLNPAAPPVLPDSDRESVSNLFGMRFPWVRGTLRITTDSTEPASDLDCRIRYDGDFTYMMAGQSPKRPLFIELLNGHSVEGVNSFQLHTMQFDQTMMRERVAAHVFASLSAIVARTAHAEVSLVVADTAPTYIGLYTLQEAVDDRFLLQNHLSESTLLLQTNGIGTLQFLGNDWNAYAPLFRAKSVPSQAQQKRIIEFAECINQSTDAEFDARIGEFVDTDRVLRYVAANALTSNLTGMSAIGVNDFLCLDPDGRFHLIASQMETALGGAVLFGTPDQLTNLRILQPYVGTCPLIDRMMNSKRFKDQYLNVMNEAMQGCFDSEQINQIIQTIEKDSAVARDRETKNAAERMRQMMLGFGPPPVGGFGGAGGGFGGAGGFNPPQPFDVKTFIAKRSESIARQLAGTDRGYTPTEPNFGGFGTGGRQGAEAPISAVQFRESVQVPEDFEATLFARSPEVNYPVAISAEPTGAIYVASDEQGSLGTDKDGGKVLRCVDANGDGVMDSVTTFCKVDHVRGVVYRSGAVWVSHPPFLSVFYDDDGDGVADRNQQLVSGLTTEMVNSRGGDHTTNGVRMGIDGWLYIGDGDYGAPHAEGLDGSTVVLRGGGILRVRPDGTELELFASGLRNPFDIAIDPQLNLFTRDNTNDGGGWDTRVSQLFHTAEYGYPRLFANFSDEIMPTLGTFGNGGGTGSLYIEDESWPGWLNRSLFTSDWGRSGVFHHPLKAAGPTFELTQETFATVPRATGMDLDANGNLFVASWWSGEASVYVGPQVGFVTRLKPRTGTQRDFPQLSDASVPELVQLLRSPNAVARFHAQGELIRRGDPAVDELVSVCQSHDDPINTRVAAIFAIKQIQGTKSHELIKSLTADPTVREFALRALADRKSQMHGLDARFIAEFLADDSARVRAQAVIALGRIGDASVASQIIPLARQTSEERPDPAEPNAEQVIPHLAIRTLVELNAIDHCLVALEGPDRFSALRALRSMHDQKAVEGLIARLGTERDLDNRNDLLSTLMRLYQLERPYDGSWWGIRPDTTGPYYDPITWEQSERIADVLTAAIGEADFDSAQRLRTELKRHQMELPGLGSMQETASFNEDSSLIVIEPVDPANPNQLGNMPFGDALSQTLAVTGNATAGAAVFKAYSCSNCHTSAAGQKPVGPHLADLGKRYKSDELIESILKPSQKIAQGYETQAFVLNSGSVVTGFVISENGKQITVRDSQGKTYSLPRDEIEERARQTTSAMPNGLVGSLTVAGLADLIAYLQSL